MGDDDKAASLLARILGCGDVAVAQGSAATKTKVVPPPAPPPPPPADVARLILIDRRGLVTDALRKALKTRLEGDLNALKVQALRFEVLWESKAPTAGQQASYGKWEYPLYFEKAHSSDNLTATEVLGVLQAHGIRNAGKGAQQYKDAESGWTDKTVEGLGIQPLQGYRKVGFLKVDQVSGRARDVETAYGNVVKHELGHMCNIMGHASAGLMLASVPIADGKVTFAADDLARIVREVGRLKAASETTMQRAYELANR